MSITYKIMETIYCNGCVHCATQLFDDTQDFEQAYEWLKEAINPDFDFLKLPYADYNEYEIWYEIEIYVNNEYDHSTFVNILKPCK